MTHTGQWEPQYGRNAPGNDEWKECLASFNEFKLHQSQTSGLEREKTPYPTAVNNEKGNRLGWPPLWENLDIACLRIASDSEMGRGFQFNTTVQAVWEFQVGSLQAE
nr:hypothetical protein L204_00734 [Cryptococcus depauperatus CBS 7855]